MRTVSATKNRILLYGLDWFTEQHDAGMVCVKGNVRYRDAVYEGAAFCRLVASAAADARRLRGVRSGVERLFCHRPTAGRRIVCGDRPTSFFSVVPDPVPGRMAGDGRPAAGDGRYRNATGNRFRGNGAVSSVGFRHWTADGVPGHFCRAGCRDSPPAGCGDGIRTLFPLRSENERDARPGGRGTDSGYAFRAGDPADDRERPRRAKLDRPVERGT